MKDAFNNFLIRFIKIRNIFRDYRDSVYNIKINIKHYIYKRFYYRLIIKMRIIDSHKIFFDDIKVIINY